MKAWTIIVMAVNAAVIVLIVLAEVERRHLLTSCSEAHARWGVAWRPAWTRLEASRRTVAAMSAIFVIDRAIAEQRCAFPPESGREGQRYRSAIGAPSFAFRDHAWRRFPKEAEFGTPDWARRHVAALRALLERQEYDRVAEAALSFERWRDLRSSNELTPWIDGLRLRRDHLLRLLSALDTAPLLIDAEQGYIARYRLDPAVDGTSGVDLELDDVDGEHGWIEER